MFTRAGFNPRHRDVLAAVFGIARKPAFLVMFVPGGDLAWWVPGRGIWWTLWEIRGFISIPYRGHVGDSWPVDLAPALRAHRLREWIELQQALNSTEPPTRSD